MQKSTENEFLNSSEFWSGDKMTTNKFLYELKVWSAMNAIILCLCLIGSCKHRPVSHELPLDVMVEIFEEIQTPYKYGVVFRHPNASKMIDSPTVFRYKDIWLMSYIVCDGQGYETLIRPEKQLHKL